MAGMITDYSLGKDLKDKSRAMDELNQELLIISQLIERLDDTEEGNKDRKEKLINRGNATSDKLRRLGQDFGVISLLGGMIKSCSSAFAAILDFQCIYEKIYFNRKVERNDIIILYKKITDLMERKKGIKQLIGGDVALSFLNNIGLSESDYQSDLEKWLDVFFNADSLIDKTPVGYIYTINRIHNSFFYLNETKFQVSLSHIRDELESIMSHDMLSLLVEDYQWFGCYIFVVYRVMDRFLKPLSNFKDCDEFMCALLLHSSENINDSNIMEQIKKFEKQVATLQEKSNNILQGIPNDISHARGLKFFQEMNRDLDYFIASLSRFVCESPWLKKQRFFFDISDKNIISLLDMIREKVAFKDKASLVGKGDFFSPKWCKTYLGYYYKPLEESINSLFVFEEMVAETRDLQIFLDYLSCDKLHQAISTGISQLFFAIQQIADLQNSLSNFKSHLLEAKVPYIKEHFLVFIEAKEKELEANQDKDNLFDDSLLFLAKIINTIPFLCSDNKTSMLILQNKWREKCDLLEEGYLNSKQLAEKSKNEMLALPSSKLEQKLILLKDPFPRLKERLQTLRTNILISLKYIEERADNYLNASKNKKLIERSESASTQIYAAVLYVRHFLNTDSGLAIPVLLEKLIQQVEVDHEENKAEINLLKKSSADCSEVVQLMIDKVIDKIKVLTDQLVELKQQKDVLMLKKMDKDFSLLDMKKMEKIVKNYEVLKDQFLFLYNLMWVLSAHERLNPECKEVTSFYAVFNDLEGFKNIYYILRNPENQRDLIEEKRPINPEENALEIELPHETLACPKVKPSLEDGFEHWKNKIEIEVNQVTSAIMSASDELLKRLHPLFVRILQHYQQKIIAKQSEYLEESSYIENAKLYLEQAFFEINRWLSYMDCRLYYFSSVYPEGNNRQYLFCQNNDAVKEGVVDANMADYLVVAMNARDIERQIAVEEKRLFNHSQSFIKPLCQNDSVYADGFVGLDRRVFEASEQMFKISQLKERLRSEKEKKQAVFEQLANKMDKQSLKSFIKRVDPQVSFEFVSTPVVAYLPVGTSASFYQLPSSSSTAVVDSGYSSHAYSFGGTPPP